MSKNFLKTNKSCHAKTTKPRVLSMVTTRKTTYKLMSKPASLKKKKEMKGKKETHILTTWKLLDKRITWKRLRRLTVESGMVAHSFNPYSGDTEADGSWSSRPARATEWDPGDKKEGWSTVELSVYILETKTKKERKEKNWYIFEVLTKIINLRFFYPLTVFLKTRDGRLLTSGTS